MNEKRVFVLKTEVAAYPNPPFHPSEHFPELDIKAIDKGNRIYGLVRETLYGLGMDHDNFGTPLWNPFKELTKPGDKVVLKPNLVFDAHGGGRQGVEAMITHASLLRPVIDYILKASQGKVRITICDAPIQSASWDKLIKQNHYQALVDYFKSKGINIELLDLRKLQSFCNNYGGIEKAIELSGDPRGNCIVDLGKQSCFTPIASDSKKLEITNYPPGTVSQHHDNTKNEYLISRTVLEADVFINIPKIKTHKKAGVTLSLKNVIGIIADKSWIAHHRRGSIYNGGDEFDTLPLLYRFRQSLIYHLRDYKFGVILLSYFFTPAKKLLSQLKKLFKKESHRTTHNAMSQLQTNKSIIITEGSWYRNDTLWRTIIDLNRCLFYADSNGLLHEEKQRRYFTLLDGIVGMEEDGPMNGLPKIAGCLVAAYNPVVNDYAVASIMGMDPDKIPSICECFKLNKYRLINFPAEDIETDSNYEYFHNIARLVWKDSLKFFPPRTWQGNVERKGFEGEPYNSASQFQSGSLNHICKE
jgi:uncharacterized protein (DUF362 family)